uniref:Wnt inhibitory factor 1 n=1 Tax=Paramormyrops kingsleyae TaxID=1676925 RepID=A0A3B3QGC8_9TELE
MATDTPAVWLLKTCFLLVWGSFITDAIQDQGSLYMWIDANQARILIGFEEDILIVSEGKMAPFTHDFRRAQQRMPAIPVNINHVNFTWQAPGQAEYFYEFQTLRSLDRDIMDDPTVNVPLLGSVPHKPSVVQVGFPCLGNQDGVAAFEVTVQVMDSGGSVVLRTPHNAIFFKTCQRAKCPGGCRNGGFCNERQVCECQDGFYGPHCEKALCSPQCLNGGLCVSPGICICPPGYYGASCEKGTCFGVMVLRSLICGLEVQVFQPRHGRVNGSKSYYCCPPLANCSTSCLNGGTCFHPGKCICPPGYRGNHCEISDVAGGTSASVPRVSMAKSAPRVRPRPPVRPHGPWCCCPGLT